MAIVRWLTSYTVWLCKWFDVSPDYINRNKRGNLPPPSGGIGDVLRSTKFGGRRDQVGADLCRSTGSSPREDLRRVVLKRVVQLSAGSEDRVAQDTAPKSLAGLPSAP